MLLDSLEGETCTLDRLAQLIVRRVAHLAEADDDAAGFEINAGIAHTVNAGENSLRIACSQWSCHARDPEHARMRRSRARRSRIGTDRAMAADHSAAK